MLPKSWPLLQLTLTVSLLAQLIAVARLPPTFPPGAFPLCILAQTQTLWALIFLLSQTVAVWLLQ